jgi:hypothetical protein
MTNGGRTASQRHRFTAVLLCSCAALLLCSSLFAQTPTSSLTGRVTWSGGARITAFAGRATVTATSKALQFERRTTATQWGRYWLTALPPGEYEVTFARKGMQTVTKRVLIELGRVARLDAHLEESEDEESVTATGKTVNVTETTAVTTHFSDETLDRLPFPRNSITAAHLAPGSLFPGLSREEGQEALEQVTVFRAAIPAEHGVFPPLVLARTRTGGEDLFLSLRGTFAEGGEHLLEAAAGGRIVPEKLWYFADVFQGSEIFINTPREGDEAKLTGQLGTRHNLTAAYGSSGIDHQYVQHIGAIGPRFTTEAVASRVESITFEETSLFLKTTFVASSEYGDHILSAGGRLNEDDAPSDSSSAFLNDRWVWGRATMNLGVRHDYGRAHPRAAATFDLRGSGRHAITASLSDYSGEFGFIRELTAGYAMAIGNTGTARIDAVRRDFGAVATEGLQADFIYSLFDRFHTGGGYAWLDINIDDGVLYPRHIANAWAGIELPVGSHEIGVTVLGRYRASAAEFVDDELATDMAIRYTLPVARVGLTVAADVLNVFNDQSLFGRGRAVRGWVRLRM